MIDIIAHLTRQAVFSRATFGPGPRTEGVLQHIEKEIVEVRKELHKIDNNDVGSAGFDDVADEMVDLVILSLDGLIRSVWAIYPNLSADEIIPMVWKKVCRKQSKNELRNWPDWRTAQPNTAIEHIKGHQD